MATFEREWQNRFGSLVPVGYLLREHLSDRWLRIHSLPESKRWPTQQSEYREVLRRHNAIATEVLGAGSPCWLVATLYEEDEAKAAKSKSPNLPLADQGTWAPPLLFQEDPDDPQVTVCWPMAVEWVPGRFDGVIQMVADDQDPRVVFVDRAHSRVYAPYDGGADLILESEERRDALRARYVDWAPSHPLGL